MNALMSVLLVASLQAESAEPLPPTGQWKVDYQSKRCVLSRDFGTGAAQRGLSLVSELGREGVKLAISQAGREPRRDKNFDVRVAAGEVTSEKLEARSTFDEALQQSVVTITLDDSLRTALPSTRRLTVTGNGYTADFAPAGMKGATAAFEKCDRNLAASIGMDLTMRDAVATRAKFDGSVSELFGMNNYPADARRNNQSGRVGMLLTIDSAGRATRCRVIEKTDSESLNITSCALFLARAKFKPALDKSGVPVPSQLVTAIDWRL